MLTDFFENVLLGYAPDVYRRLAVAGLHAGMCDVQHRCAVAGALWLLGRMWAEAKFPDGVDRALVQQFSDAVIEVFGYRRAAMVVAPDFAEPLVRELADGDFGTFSFPRIDDFPPVGDVGPQQRTCTPPQAVCQPPQVVFGLPPLVVGGDVAVISAGAVPEAHRLVQQLTNPQSALPWINGYGGFLAANTSTPSTSYTPELRALAEQLNSNERSIEFDLSDQLGAPGGRAGLWRVLQDFLGKVGGRGADADLGGAVDQALAELQKFEG